MADRLDEGDMLMCVRVWYWWVLKMGRYRALAGGWWWGAKGRGLWHSPDHHCW
jgi:hypothetical protein